MGETVDVLHDNPVEGRRGNLDAPTLEWEDTITSARAYGNPSVAVLCGFANSSRHLAPYDDFNKEIWGCNEANNSDFLKTTDGQFRADRWFQVHQEEDWSRGNNPNDLRHPEWLAAKHNFPIYMQEEFESVPSSVRIPREKMDEYFFGGVYTIDANDGKTKPWLDIYGHGYYTSTFAWMMAMAIFLKKEVIEIWGFNMGTKSEYMYQKPGGEFWVGQALARGIEVRIAGNSPILKGHMYGIEIADVLLPSQLTARIKELETEYSPIKSEALQYHGSRLELENMLEQEEFAEKFDELGKRLITRSQQELTTTCKVNFYQGAINESKQYKRHLDVRHDGVEETGWVDRLTMEVRKSVLRDEIEELRSFMNYLTGAKAELKLVQELHDTLDLSERYMELQNKEIEWANRLSYNLGSISQNEYYITQSEGRNPNMSDEHDYGFLIVPDLFPSEGDVLDWNFTGDNDGETEETAEQEADEGGATGDPELPSESPQRPIDKGPVRGPAQRDERGSGGDRVGATEGDQGREPG